jgi:hypothetical protein
MIDDTSKLTEGENFKDSDIREEDSISELSIHNVEIINSSETDTCKLNPRLMLSNYMNLNFMP